MNKNWTATNNDHLTATALKSDRYKIRDCFDLAAKNLPTGYIITICVERDSGWVKWESPDGIEYYIDDETDDIETQFRLAYQRCMEHYDE